MTIQEEEFHFKVNDEVWHKGGYFYQKATITAIEGEQVTLGNEEATIDNLLPASIFNVPDGIVGLTYETHIYNYLVFRTYTSNLVSDMDAREKAEGLYVEKSVGETYQRQHFPGRPAGKADVLRLLADLEERT